MKTRYLLIALCFTPAIAFGTKRLGPEAIPICFDFGCKTKKLITLKPHEWAEISGFFAKPAATPKVERRQIQQAAGWLEVLAGRYTPIHRDRGQNNLDNGTVGQMDCIDESLNMATYLKLMEDQGLLRHHRVLERAYRRTMWDQHWAGHIQEVKSKERWVVDSWFHDFGLLPYVENAKEWEDIPFMFTSYR